MEVPRAIAERAMARSLERYQRRRRWYRQNAVSGVWFSAAYLSYGQLSPVDASGGESLGRSASLRNCGQSPPGQYLAKIKREETFVYGPADMISFFCSKMYHEGGGSEAFEQAAREVEAEVKRAVEYIETNVVPKARRDGEKVLRRLSEELSRWADRLHDEEQQK
jgi:hypothetical protein